MIIKQPASRKFFSNERWLRFFMATVLLGVSILYFPINRSVAGGFSPDLQLDQAIPLRPLWAVPYLLSILWWLAAMGWIFVRMEFKAVKTVFFAFLIMTLSSYAVYLLMPTYVTRPDLTGTSWAFELVRWIYGNDQPYNALPSGHTYNTVIIMLILWSWKPRQRWLWVFSVLIVILSTLFTRQHYLLDIVFGTVWAVGALALAKKISGWPLQQSSPSQPQTRIFKG